MKALIASLALATLTACQTTAQPGIEIRTVEVIKEVPMPCAAEVPERPLPFVKPTGEGLEALAAALAAKLAAYSAPGKYADQAEAYFAACPNTE
jgi:hypothetical protein